MNDPSASPAPRKRGRPRKNPPPAAGSGGPTRPPDIVPSALANTIITTASAPPSSPADMVPYYDLEERRIDTSDADFDLTITPDALLTEQDLVTHRRVNYVISLLRLQHFLRRQPATFTEEFAQAKIASKVVSDTESSELELHRYGRQTGDTRLANQIAQMRSQLASLADKRARARMPHEPPQTTPTDD